LDAADSFDGCSGIAAYFWQLDEESRTGPVVTHVYDEPGSYNVTLRVIYEARMSVPKLVCEVSYASCFAWFVCVDCG
jgi:hypothetical protein